MYGGVTHDVLVFRFAVSLFRGLVMPRTSQTNLSSVTRIEIIYFRCNTDVSLT